LQISKITEGKHSNFHIYIGDEYAFTVTDVQLAQNSLSAGAELNREDIARLSAEYSLFKAKSQAANLLSFKSYSKNALVERLKRKGADAEAALAAAQRYEELGYINDLEYAKKLAEYLLNIKKFGKRRIQDELFAKRVPREIIDQTVQSLEDEDFYERAKEVVLQKFGESPFEQKEKKRIYDSLLRQGYSFDEAKYAVSV
jgi:regulatory protein